MAFVRTDLGEDAFVDYDPAWVSAEEGRGLHRTLIDAFDWEQRPISVFGKAVMQPRLIAWMGELPYRYSGQVLEVRPIEGPVAELTARVSALVGVEFNHVLLNRYRNGMDNMGMHADDEPELGPEPVIAALSLGVSRKFALRHKRRKGRKLDLTLHHGSLLVMGGTIQHKWRHGVPKQRSVAEERINVTFRRLLRPPRPPRVEALSDT